MRIELFEMERMQSIYWHEGDFFGEMYGKE